MTDIDTTLTDYGLAILCFWFVWRLFQQESKWPEGRVLWITFFITIALAAITGGTVHGFFLDEFSLGYLILWPATLLIIGLTAAVAWILAGLMLMGRSKLKPWFIFASIEFVIYVSVVVFYSRQFMIVIFNYLPAIVVLLIASILGYKKTRAQYFIWISLGILTSFVAAFIQQAGIAIDPVYFNHNSSYHAVQALGLWFYYKGSTQQLQTILS